MNKKQIINYYDQTEIDYKLLWSLNSSMALHYGFWDQTTHNLPQALQRENEILAQMASIKSTDLVLDAGCGVGGSSIYLAKNYGCKVIGITLSQKQADLAWQNAKKYQVEHLIKFKVMDFTHTSFDDKTFDVIWAIESVCHALNKEQLIKEVFRILKKGGRLILADFFAKRDNYLPKEANIMSKWLQGWSVNFLETVINFEQYLQKTGFKNIIFKNVTKNIIPSAKKLYAYSVPGRILGRVLNFLNVRSALQHANVLAAYYQYQALKQDLWQYNIFKAVKN